MNDKNNNIVSSYSEEIDTVFQLIKSGKTDGISELSSLLEKYPDNLDIMGHLWTALAIKGEHQKAINILTRYKELQPENLEVQWRIGDRLVNLGKLDEALATYKEVLREHPDCMDAKMGIRYVDYLMRNKPDEKEIYVPQKKNLSEKQEENLHLNEKEFKKQKLTLKSLPPYFYLESTTKCNYYCRTCAKGYGPYYAEDLQKDIFEKVQRELMPANVKISITGFGEPTLASNFNEILRMTLDNGSKVQFVTNASLLNFKRIEKLTRYPVAICLSIDGATKKTFEEIRAGSNFERICEKLAMIKKLRDIHLSENLSQFSFHFVALKENIQELPDVVQLAHRYRFSSVGVSDYAFIHKEFDVQSLRYEPDIANQYMKKAKKVAEELGIRLLLPPEYFINPLPTSRSSLWGKIKKTLKLFSKKNRFPHICYSPWQEPYIRTDGTVVPCCASGMYLGSLKKNSFEKIWNGWRYRWLRFRIQSFIPPIGCRNCNVTWGINGGNAGNVIVKEGLLVKAFYFCEYHSRRYGRKLRRFLRKLIYRLKGQKIPEIKPNYYRGRPIVSQNKVGIAEEISHLI